MYRLYIAVPSPFSPRKPVREKELTRRELDTLMSRSKYRLVCIEDSVKLVPSVLYFSNVEPSYCPIFQIVMLLWDILCYVLGRRKN